MSRRDEILEACGFVVPLLGDQDGDGDVDLADVSLLRKRIGDGSADLQDVSALRANFGKQAPVTLVHGSGTFMRTHPSLRSVHTIGSQNKDKSLRTVEDVRRRARKYREDYGAEILFLDNELSVNGPEDFKDRCKLLAEMCEAVRDEGLSPGVVSMAPWSHIVKLNWKMTYSGANQIAGEHLIPHVDWLGWEMYGSQPERLNEWLDMFKSLEWDCCIAPFLNPIRFQTGICVTCGEYERMVEIAHEKGDITLLWTSYRDSWATVRFLYDVIAMREWGCGNPGWLKINV